MVSESTSVANRMKCYRVLQAHAKKVAENEYTIQLAAHLKKGRKHSTFKFTPTEVLNKLVRMSKDVAGTRNTFTGKVTYKITPKEVMGYIAHDYDFNKERYG